MQLCCQYRQLRPIGFSVIYSVGESEILVGAENFTFMADILSTQLIESRAREEMWGYQ